MAKTTVFYNGRSQAVRIPKELRFDTSHVEVRRFGDGLLLEPIKDEAWPAGYFENIRVEDAGFSRPDQGDLPPSPELPK